jgi:hypothetical protein
VPKVILYCAAGFLVVVVWSYYKTLVYRARIIEHLKTKHPDQYSRVMVDVSEVRWLDRLFADFEVIKRQANQETNLLKVSSGGDPELDRLRTVYRRALVATACTVVVFLMGTLLVVVLARGR